MKIATNSQQLLFYFPIIVAMSPLGVGCSIRVIGGLAVEQWQRGRAQPS